jgi:hypothetical protein
MRPGGEILRGRCAFDAEQALDRARVLGACGLALQSLQAVAARQRGAAPYQPAHVDDLGRNQGPRDGKAFRRAGGGILRAADLEPRLVHRAGEPDRIAGRAAPYHRAALADEFGDTSAGDGRPAMNVHRRDQFDRPLVSRLAFPLHHQQAIVGADQGGPRGDVQRRRHRRDRRLVLDRFFRQ